MERKRTYRKKPLAVFENGTRIYSPTEPNSKFRVVSRDPIGRRVYAKFDSEERARERARLFEQQLANSTTPVVGNRAPRTVGELGSRYVRSLRTKSARYQERQESIIRLWVIPHLGDRPLHAWTPAGSEQVLNDARARVAPATVQNIGATLRSMVTLAHKERWFDRTADPMWHVSYSPTAEFQGHAVGYIPRDALPDDTQCNALFAALHQQHQPEWALAMRLAHRTGLRWGELIGLRVSDIDLEPHRIIRVERAVEQTRTGRQLKTTKNRQKRYTIYPASLTQPLAQHLTVVRATRGEHGLLFVDRHGQHPDRRAFIRIWLRAAQAAGWDMKSTHAARWHPHDLRHVAACWMLFDLKLDPPLVAQLLGHANANFTLTRYVGVRGDPRQTLTNTTNHW